MHDERQSLFFIITEEERRLNVAMILAGGVGQRMRTGGLPKQFLKLMGKPIIVYTIEKFQACEQIDEIIVVCHNSWIELMEKLVAEYQLSKVIKVVVGGSDRQASIVRGLELIEQNKINKEDIIIIHDGVRPLVTEATINENIRVAKEKGNAMTVKAVTESVVITDEETAEFQNFKKREATYSLTSPQSFRYQELKEAYAKMEKLQKGSEIPLLDTAILYASMGKNMNLVKELGVNLKITTPEDFYYLRAILEMEENKFIFGL